MSPKTTSWLLVLAATALMSSCAAPSTVTLPAPSLREATLTRAGAGPVVADLGSPDAAALQLTLEPAVAARAPLAWQADVERVELKLTSPRLTADLEGVDAPGALALRLESRLDQPVSLTILNLPAGRYRAWLRVTDRAGNHVYLGDADSDQDGYGPLGEPFTLATGGLADLGTIAVRLTPTFLPLPQAPDDDPAEE